MRELVVSLREHLRWEEEIGGIGLPALRKQPSSSQPSASQPSASQPSASQPSSSQPSASQPSSSQPGVGRAPSPLTRREEAERALARLAEEAERCTSCELRAGRTKSVFARGNPEADLLFVGEGPGAQEDLSGLPFVGPAGALLDRMIQAMGFAPEDVYICNVVKCRPPENRRPRTEEAAHCERFLTAQLATVSPRVIVALGRCAAEALGCGGRGWRGRWGEFRGVPVMPTYHPAYLLRTPADKRLAWDDLQTVMNRLRGPGG